MAVAVRLDVGQCWLAHYVTLSQGLPLQWSSVIAAFPSLNMITILPSGSISIFEIPTPAAFVALSARVMSDCLNLYLPRDTTNTHFLPFQSPTQMAPEPV